MLANFLQLSVCLDSNYLSHKHLIFNTVKKYSTY